MKAKTPVDTFIRHILPVKITVLLFWIILVFYKSLPAQQQIGLETKLVPDSLDKFEYIGGKVALSGNIAVVSGYEVNGNPTAFIFEFNGNDWIQTDRLKIVEPGTQYYDSFVFDIDIEDNVVVVGVVIGVQMRDINVHVFNYNGIKWNAAQKIILAQRIAGAAWSLSLSGCFISARLCSNL